MRFSTPVLLVFAIAICMESFAEDGVTATEIKVGQAAALTGPAAGLGQGMQAGMQACFSAVNAAGGVNGRTITLVTKDDGYEPNLSIGAVRELLDTEKVFLLIGGVGTPTAQAMVPICEERQVPFVAPFTGAGFLREPFKKHVINVRASYGQETERMAQYLVDEKKLTKIACFYQNDGFGQTGLKGITEALKKRNMNLVTTGNFERNTVSVKGALLQIRSAHPEAVVMIGPYKPCAEFIKLAKTVGMQDTVFINVSFVGSEALRQELGAAGEGVLITQVVCYPWDEHIPIVKEYADAMRLHRPDAEIGFVSLEGYVAAKLFVNTLAKMTGEPTRAGFIDTVEKTGTYALGGMTLEFGAEDHQGMNDVFLTAIQGGKVVQPK
jgi:branched-chain amino acid transport system substrate-binding protein